MLSSMNSFVNISAATTPAVVSIEARHPASAAERPELEDIPEPFRDFFDFGPEGGAVPACRRPHHIEQIRPRRHMETPEPGLQGYPSEGQALLLAEIDDVQRSAGVQCGKRAFDGILPGGNHRQCIGDDDAVESAFAEIAGGEVGGFPLRGSTPIEHDLDRVQMLGHRRTTRRPPRPVPSSW